MGQKGMMHECRRCGATHFCKFIETVTTAGGFGSSYDKYEPLPDSWLNVHDARFGGVYCPDCAVEFHDWFGEWIGNNGK